MSRIVRYTTSGKSNESKDLDCGIWASNPLKNPATNRIIKPHGATYQKIRSLCYDYLTRSSSPKRSKSPSTKRKSRSPRRKTRSKSPERNVAKRQSSPKITKRQLVKMAAGIIPGFSVMTKRQLIAALASMPHTSEPLPYVTANTRSIVRGMWTSEYGE
jgi:2-cysteine adaptor domain